MRWEGALIIAVAFGVAGWLVRGCHDVRPMSERIDSVLVVRITPPVIIHDTMRLTRTRTDTVYRHDTIIRRVGSEYIAPPFIATLDSVVGRDTVSATFEYPSAAFRLALRRAPDSTYTITRYVTLPCEPRPMWLDVLSHIGAGLVGVGVGAVWR